MSDLRSMGITLPKPRRAFTREVSLSQPLGQLSDEDIIEGPSEAAYEIGVAYGAMGVAAKYIPVGYMDFDTLEAEFFAGWKVGRRIARLRTNS